MKQTKFKLFGIIILCITIFTNCGGNDIEPIIENESDVIKKLKVGIMDGTLTKNFTLDSAIKYSLKKSFIVDNGATLTIPAGTKITAKDGSVDVYLAVLQGGKINIQGTADNPVVMGSVSGKPGDWGGLTICGKAVTTAGTNATAEIGGFKYGGTENEDNSGSINYLVIKGTGAQINADSQYNGVSLYAVGSKTTINGVSVINGADDGIEFFGGTVSVTNLYLENNEDDSIDWTEGWSGTVTNTYIAHTLPGFSTAFEGDKNNNNPKFINVTAISKVPTSKDSNQIALQFKKKSGATITNLYLDGYTKNIDMKDNGPLSNVIIEGATAKTSATYKNKKLDISSWTWKNKGL